MFIEYCEGGAVDSIMLNLDKPLTEPQIQYICKEMCDALQFLHSRCVIHRDVKAGNVLLTSDGCVRIGNIFSITMFMSVPFKHFILSILGFS